MGLSIQKEWLATLDHRTRVSHQHLDGERVPYNKKFSNGLMFPADPSGDGAEIYNCRCTMFAVLPETEKDTRETYSDWVDRKKSEMGEDAFEIERKMVVNRSADKAQYQRYKEILGNETGKSFAEFQNIKYNNAEKLEEIKKEYKRGVDYLGKYPNSNAKVFRASREINKRKLQKGELVPSVIHPAKLISEGTFDPEHIFRRMAERGATLTDLENIMNKAEYMLVQWRGQRRCYITSFGAVVITKTDSNEWAYKTVWIGDSIQEGHKEMIEVMKRYGLKVDKE